MRWVHPDGWTVETVTLSDTGPPNKPGDPPSHVGPRDYFRVSRVGNHGKPRTYGYVPTLEELAELADREAWNINKLREAPTHVVMDHTGKIYSHDATGKAFDRASAEKFAAERNEAASDGYKYSHRVQVLGGVN